MTIYLRRCNPNNSVPGGCDAQANNPEEVRTPPTISSYIEKLEEALYTFGRAEHRLQKTTNRFAQKLTEHKIPLTEELEMELEEWNRQADEAKRNRLKPLDAIEIDQILDGIVVYKRYTLYLESKISEISQKP